MNKAQKGAFEAAVRVLEGELRNINMQIQRRKWDINVLAEKQAIQKRERNVLSEEIYRLKKEIA